MNADPFQHAQATLQARIEALLAIALVGGCRLAVSEPCPILRGTDDYALEVVHVMLSPGEKPPAGRAWTIYELHADGWRGRSV